MSRTIALVPIRSLHGGKTRLAGMFDPNQRAQFVVRMANRLIEKLAESGIADEIVVLTGDDAIREIFASDLVTVPPEVPPGLNAAVDAGRRYAIEQQADRLLVVFPDLPEVTTSDLQAVDRSGSAVTIIPDRQRDGTNALLLQGGHTLRAFEFRYGRESLTAHTAVGEQLGLPVDILPVPGMAIDLDTPADWHELADETRCWLLEPFVTLVAPGVPTLALEHS